MKRSEAARFLTEMLAELQAEKGKFWMKDKYYEAVTLACGVLLVDDVLKSNAKSEERSDEWVEM